MQVSNASYLILAELKLKGRLFVKHVATLWNHFL